MQAQPRAPQPAAQPWIEPRTTAPSYPVRPEVSELTFDTRLNRQECRQWGVRYERHNGLWGCWKPADHRSVRSTSLRVEPPAPAYPVPTVRPPQLPLRMFVNPMNDLEPVSGESLYISYVVRYGEQEGWRQFIDHVELQRQECLSSEEPRRPTNYERSRHEYGYSYSGRGGGYRVYDRYRRQDPVTTPAEREYDAERATYNAVEGLCEDFNRGYRDSGGYRNSEWWNSRAT